MYCGRVRVAEWLTSICLGGDPGSDFLFSPLEPAFYLHHQQVDRLYFIWQNLDWENRQVRNYQIRD